MEMLCTVGRIVDISEPILAEDSSFSRLALSLTAILEQLDKRDDATTQDYLVALLLVLLAESGFRVASVTNSSMWEQNTRMVHIPADWKTSEKNIRYKINLVLNNLQNTQSDLIVFNLEDKLVVNLCSRIGEQQMYSMIVDTLKYVNPHTSNSCLRYMNLKDISHRFKDQLCTPIRSNILSTLNLSNPSFLGLPLELQIEIASMLDTWEICRLARCSRTLFDICLDPMLNLKLNKKKPKALGL
ncbi:F-box only protein 7 isoform X2 [Linepithema humile]|uniref:F-box only protein 7 isoform X2 n=1 Tax=Linepithema humile TaxID=83485 RepID=UPI00351DC252